MHIYLEFKGHGHAHFDLSFSVHVYTVSTVLCNLNQSSVYSGTTEEEYLVKRVLHKSI